MQKLVLFLALAWVLWSKFVPLGAGADESKWRWALVSSTTQEADCRRDAARLQAGQLTGITGDTTFLCFPDTLDPRPRR
jgi:hypothetical protein